MTLEAELELRLSILEAQPIGEAAAGDAAALLNLTQQIVDLAMSQTGEERRSSFNAANVLGRLAAWHSSPASARLMGAILIGSSESGVNEARRAIDFAEGIAWLHRAADAGDNAAESYLDVVTSNPANADLIAIASRIEKKL